MVIDIDLLDERLVDALDDDLRVIRRGEAPTPRPVAAAPPRVKESPKPAKAPKPVKTLRPAKPIKPFRAKAPAPVPGPAPTPMTAADAAGGAAQQIVELLRQARLAEADHHIAMHAALALESRDPHRRHDAATWATMRALLDGNEAKARSGVASARSLGTEAHDPDTMDRYWAQRFWIAFEWGDEEEQLELLDHCRERSYRYDDLEWRAPLTLALARLDRTDEARREFDVTYDELRLAIRFDLMSMLAEAAALLGDVERCARVQRHLEGHHAQLVVLGPGWVCNGALARYQAHAAAGIGAWDLADQRFRTAVEVHRDLLAEPLLARTLREWGCSMIGRDNIQARLCLRESDEMARRLRLVGLVSPTQPLPAA